MSIELIGVVALYIGGAVGMGRVFAEMYYPTEPAELLWVLFLTFIWPITMVCLMAQGLWELAAPPLSAVGWAALRGLAYVFLGYWPDRPGVCTDWGDAP